MKRSILVAVIASLALAGCNTSYNYFADDDEGAPTPAGGFNLAKSLMKHTGVVPKDNPQIKYEARAPLAMPNTQELPAPEDRNASNAVETAVNFPVDQDTQNKNRRQELANALASGQTIATRDADGNPVTRQGLNRLPPEAVAQQEEAAKGKPGFQEASPVRSLKEMRKKLRFRAPSAELITAEGKAAPRKYLIQPPDEYRTPAETAALPEEGDIENSEWIDKQLYRDVGKTNRPTYLQN